MPQSPESLAAIEDRAQAGVNGSEGTSRLVVVSNRVPGLTESSTAGQDRNAPVGGLVSALKPAMEIQGGLWVGWSGKTTQRRADTLLETSQLGSIRLATLDLSEDDVSLYYTGFANRTLWPLLHYFPERVDFRQETYRAYRRINRRFAIAVFSELSPGDTVWVHDFHLFHVGEELRNMGWKGKIGFFLHVPVPPADVLGILPWARDILEACLHYDLVGVHTQGYLRNLVESLATLLGGTLSGQTYACGELSTRLGAYPIGIDPTPFRPPSQQSGRGLTDRLSIPSSPAHKTILGVDRLDYTKGVPERLMAYERLLYRHRSLRGRVTLAQISSPSRTRVPEYIAEKERVEELVARINGRFSQDGWSPIRYRYRSYPREELARFYRDADVCMVTPLRDGMNLVAKEYVASQGDDPGVLVLSRFSGAASELRDALIVNPYDVEATAAAIHEALRMPPDERKRRWQGLIKAVEENTSQSWAEGFLADLASFEPRSV